MNKVEVSDIDTIKRLADSDNFEMQRDLIELSGDVEKAIIKILTVGNEVKLSKYDKVLKLV